MCWGFFFFFCGNHNTLNFLNFPEAYEYPGKLHKSAQGLAQVFYSTRFIGHTLTVLLHCRVTFLPSVFVMERKCESYEYGNTNSFRCKPINLLASVTFFVCNSANDLLATSLFTNLWLNKFIVEWHSSGTKLKKNLGSQKEIFLI